MCCVPIPGSWRSPCLTWIGMKLFYHGERIPYFGYKVDNVFVDSSMEYAWFTCFMQLCVFSTNVIKLSVANS